MWSGLIALGTVSTLLAGGYLAQVSTVASKGYMIRSLQSEVDDLKQEAERLEFEVAKGRSMIEVEEKVSDMGMVPASEIEYMTLTEPVVAKR